MKQNDFKLIPLLALMAGCSEQPAEQVAATHETAKSAPQQVQANADPHAGLTMPVSQTAQRTQQAQAARPLVKTIAADNKTCPLSAPGELEIPVAWTGLPDPARCNQRGKHGVGIGVWVSKEKDRVFGPFPAIPFEHRIQFSCCHSMAGSALVQ